jgi:hypothetical protein
MKTTFKNALLMVLGLGILISSCVPYQSAYKSSQTLLNQAVDIETAYRVQQLEKEVPNPEPSSEARAKFEEANKSIVAFITEHEPALKNDNLYGNALALRGLSEFYLEKNEAATNTATESIAYLENSADNNKTRDLALMRGMSGLVLANQMYDKIQAFDRTGAIDKIKYKEVGDMARAAVSGIDKGRQGVSATHPVNEFLTMSELAVYKNWLDFIPYGVDSNSSEADKAKSVEEEKEVLQMSKSAVERLNTATGGKKADLVKYWKVLLGID